VDERLQLLPQTVGCIGGPFECRDVWSLMRELAHKDAIAGADFFTTEVWTWRGLGTMYTVFDRLGLSSVQILGSTAHPDEAFMRQVARILTMANAETCRALVCDRDTKWERPVREWLCEAVIRIAQTPYRAPKARLTGGTLRANLPGLRG
jgi:hypothetical protein